MTRLRRLRRRRSAYRVYGEEEYLAGADALAVEEDARLCGIECPAHDEPPHGRRLQRLAGAAALTGTVGAVGGIVGLASSRTHARALDRREIAQRAAPSARVARVGARSSALPAGPSLHAPHGRGPGRRPSSRIHKRRRVTAPRISLGTVSPARAPVRGLTVGAARIAPAHEVDLGAGTATEATSASGGAAGGVPVRAPSAAQAPPPAGAARPAAQSEFGFER